MSIDGLIIGVLLGLILGLQYAIYRELDKLRKLLQEE